MTVTEDEVVAAALEEARLRGDSPPGILPPGAAELGEGDVVVSGGPFSPVEAWPLPAELAPGETFGLTDPHVVAGVAYCWAVVTGERVENRYVVAACRRQLSDLHRWRTEPEYPYKFSERKAGRAARFYEELPHVEGPLANADELLTLGAWQCFIVTAVYGWCKKSTGLRRFRRVYVEIPRGNGKSFMSAGTALYGLAADGEQGAQVYTAATTVDQAKAVFGTAQKMLRKRPELLRRLGLKDSTHTISRRRNNGIFYPLSREARNHEGKNIHVGIVDELHVHPTREVYDVIKSGTGKRPQSILWTITTAGTNVAGICFEVRGFCVKVLEHARDGDGFVEDDGLFCLIYTIDEGDDEFDERTWRKANPNFGISVDVDDFRQKAYEARHSPSARANFRTKHLNVWINAATQWMQMGAWDRCGDPRLTPGDCQGDALFTGSDLASKIDLACSASVFVRDLPHRTRKGETERHYFAFVRSYLPELQVERAGNASYRGWVEEGRIATTPGATIDQNAIKGDLVDDHARFRTVENALDQWQGVKLGKELEDEAGMLVVLVPNTTKEFSPAMKEIEAAVLDGRFHHDANPAVRWAVGNVCVKPDAKGNIYPRKQKDDQKIDPAVAIILAVNRAMLYVDEPDPYSSGGGLKGV